ncbi:MAG: sugar transferase [Erythrobacter sp.]
MLLHRPKVQASAKKRLIAYSGVQFLVYVFCGLGLPVLFWVAFRNFDLGSVFLLNTLYSLGVGTIIVWHTLARLREYAKSRQLSYVIPVNFLAFGTVLGIIALFRMTYSIPLFVLGVLGTFIASYVLTAINRRNRQLQYLVPGGKVDEVEFGVSFVPVPPIEELQSLVEARRVEGAIVADLHYDHPPEWERLFARAALNGIPVYHFRQIVEMQTGQVRISHLSENDLGSLIPNVPYMASKRMVDILGAMLIFPICLLLFVIIGIAIKLTSPGKIFFIQERVGFRAQKFRMIKFRTMHECSPSSDEDKMRDDAMTKSEDGRITSLGKFLRKTRLDELPQIFNILSGDMSWIGPRPEAVALSEWYEGELPFYSYRHILRPGITGWAQVNQGHVTDLNDVTAKLRYDFYYVKNVSLWLDALIALKTLRVIVTGTGAR